MNAAVKSLTICALLTASLFAGINKAYCESQPAIIFYSYIRDLYYAKNIQQVAKYYIASSRVPYMNLKGQAAVYELEKLKTGYVFNPKITTQVMQGKRCLMKGIGVANDLGRTFPCTLDVIMVQEDGTWRIQYYTWSATIH